MQIVWVYHAAKFTHPDLKEFRMSRLNKCREASGNGTLLLGKGGEFHSDASRHFRFIVFSPTRLFCLPRSGATDYPLLVAVSSGTNPCSGRRFVCNDLRQGFWKGLTFVPECDSARDRR